MSIQGIPESSPVEDSNSDERAPWSRSDGRGPENRPLLRGEDEVSLSPPGLSALGIVHGCLLDSISQALGVERRATTPIVGWDQVEDPVARAGHLASEVAAMLQQACTNEHPAPAGALIDGARQGADQALELLGRMGHLEGEAGEVVTALLDAWGSQLMRLVEKLESPLPD